MEKRKQKEAEFHDEVRDRSLESNKKKYGYLTSNRRFYSIARGSEKFIKDFLIKNCPGEKVLDYCCGEGPISLFVAENGASMVTGIDLSSISIKICKDQALGRGLEKKTSFIVMDAENLKFSNDYFDLIICAGVLHHLDIKKAYKELSRVLKPYGKIICAEPLIHNPLFQLYRRVTPHLRTKWETEHILNRSDIKLAENYFGRIEIYFFHLATLFAVPFRSLPFFNFILGILEKIDSIILKLPFLKWWAWQVVFILSEPKK